MVRLLKYLKDLFVVTDINKYFLTSYINTLKLANVRKRFLYRIIDYCTTVVTGKRHFRSRYQFVICETVQKSIFIYFIFVFFSVFAYTRFKI